MIPVTMIHVSFMTATMVRVVHRVLTINPEEPKRQDPKGKVQPERVVEAEVGDALFHPARSRRYQAHCEKCGVDDNAGNHHRREKDRQRPCASRSSADGFQQWQHDQISIDERQHPAEAGAAGPERIEASGILPSEQTKVTITMRGPSSASTGTAIHGERS
ncbi:hypothetical protein RHAL1_P00070 (plasmid) [Beijerinckiaceae bacterium RH AL1]|nr:hypothetical protein RHAL1_P00070 [Beijerinckiaceae bacterium RH AL1]